MTPKKWLLVVALAVVVLLIAAVVLYYSLPTEFISDEKFRAVCGEHNECLWLDSGK